MDEVSKNYCSITINEPESKPISEIVFYFDRDNWLIKIKGDGIHFNHELYPNATPNYFAEAFIEILEKNYNITFTKRENK